LKTPLAGLEALTLLPADTLAVVAAADVPGLLDRLGRKEIVEKYREPYEKLIAEMIQEVGYNLLDPKAYADIGIDVSAPVGLAWLSVDPVGIVAFARLTDAEKFKTALYSMAGRVREKMVPHVVGDAMLICPEHDEELCFILKGSHVFLHAYDTSDELALEKAKAFAGPAASPSLAGDKTLLDLLARLHYGKDVAGYASSSAILSKLGAPGPSYADTSLEQSRKALEEAKRGGVKEEIDAAEQRVKSDQAWAEESRKRREKELAFYRQAFGTMGSFALGVDLRETDIAFTVLTQVPDGTPMATLFRNIDGTSQLVRSLSTRPQYLAHFSADLPQYVAFVLSSLESLGVDPKAAREEFRQSTGLDLDKDVLATLGTDVAVAVGADFSAADQAEEKVIGSVEVHALLGVSARDKAVALLDKIAALPGASMFFAKEGDKFRIKIPQMKPILVTVLDKYIVISTDPSFAGSVASGEDRSFLDAAPNPDMKALLFTPNSAGILMMDFSAFGYFFLSRRLSSSAVLAEREPAAGPTPTSEEYKAKEKELKELEDKLRSEYDRLNREEERLAQSLLKRVGTLVIATRHVDGIVEAEGRQIPGEATLKAAVVGIAEDAVGLEVSHSQRWGETWKLEDRKYQLQSELRQMRDAAAQNPAPPDPSKAPAEMPKE
jgi:hypothetical protein